MATNSNLKRDPTANAVSMAPDREVELEETPMRETNAVDEQFPAVYEKTSKKDALKVAKLQMQTPQRPGVTPFGQLRATEDDFKWLQAKREAEEIANFDQWFANNFDLMSPAQKAQARTLYPNFYVKRMALLDKQVELTREIAKLKLNGIQDVKDLRLQYALEKGIIDEDPLVHILHPEKSNLNDDVRRQYNFKRGLLSRKAYPRGNYGMHNRLNSARNITGRYINHDAALAGVGENNFSVYGDDMTYQMEGVPQNNRLLDTLVTANGGLRNPIAAADIGAPNGVPPGAP